MIKILIVFGILVMHTSCFSQTLQQEINNQVWRVQLKAMSENDPEKFISVMSDSVVQISYDRNIIRDKKEFHKQAVATYNRIKERKLVRSMEFRFLNRLAGNATAFEDGFFRYGITAANNEKKVFYGYFQVVLKKEAGAWKVLVDYDSEKYNGAAVTMQMFNEAKTLESYEK